jgi:hypothetical protein
VADEEPREDADRDRDEGNAREVQKLGIELRQSDGT